MTRESSRLKTIIIVFSFVLEHLDEGFGAEGFGPFDGEAESAVPDEGGKDSEGATHAEHDSVIIHLLQSVVLKENAGMRVNVRPWVFRLALLQQDVRY